MGANVPFTVIGTPPPDAESLRNFAYIATSIILFLSTSSLILRVFARWKQYKGFKLDDYLIFVGYFIALMPSICVFFRTNLVPPSRPQLLALTNIGAQYCGMGWLTI